MNRIRSITAAGVTLVVVAGAAVASGAVDSGTPPPAKPLAQAIHDAIAAPPVNGITARITFTNKLIDSSSLIGGGPLIVGGGGRLWISNDGRARIELQSDRGDAQIVTDGKKLTVYDASSNTAYEATLPQHASDHESGDAGTTPGATTPEPTTPSVSKISDVLTKVGKAVDLSGADPTVVAGQGAYSVKITPHNGGLVGKAEIAWDAASGVPLRAGIYATGSTKPVLELAATDISYGPVAESALNVPVPAGATVKTIDLPSSTDANKPSDADIAAAKAEHKKLEALTPTQVAAQLPFTLSAPATLAGQAQDHVRLVEHTAKDGTKTKAALVTYGTGLGGLAVLEAPVDPADATAAPTTPASGGRHHGDGQVELKTPTVDIGGAKASVISTALGTLVTFERGGVKYTVVGSVTSAVAEAAARGL